MRRHCMTCRRRARWRRFFSGVVMIRTADFAIEKLTKPAKDIRQGWEAPSLQMAVLLGSEAQSPTISPSGCHSSSSTSFPGHEFPESSSHAWLGWLELSEHSMSGLRGRKTNVPNWNFYENICWYQVFHARKDITALNIIVSQSLAMKE